MPKLSYYLGGKLQGFNFTGLQSSGPAVASSAKGKGPRSPRIAGPSVAETLHAQKKRLSYRFHDVSETQLLCSSGGGFGTMVVPTETIAIDGARMTEINWLSRKFGMEVVQEGRRGKVLLRSPEGGRQGVQMAFDVAQQTFKRGHVNACHPNFLRVVQRPAPSSGTAKKNWGIDNDGKPGIVGADAHGLAAWTITEGDDDIRVAILDEGVDTLHPWLRDAVVDEADFVDDNIHARPDGDDAHGTACAGIVVSRHSISRGLAPNVSLVAVRIAKSDNAGFWIFDDFDTADAIDWSWDDANADILSNSWGGGPAVDIITRAFERARTQGRGGKGSVIVIAAGNSQTEMDYPGNLPNMLTVGASNQWDERKTKHSKDGETWWGSNYGDSLDLLAPGVSISTTDIRGARGYSNTLHTGSFNGTSSSTPHVAAAAALVLSVKPKLKESDVRRIINETADPLTSGNKWNKFEGHGRLNTYAAIRLARR